VEQDDQLPEEERVTARVMIQATLNEQQGHMHALEEDQRAPAPNDDLTVEQRAS
jgi:hypothetical protein